MRALAASSQAFIHSGPQSCHDPFLRPRFALQVREALVSKVSRERVGIELDKMITGVCMG